MKNIIITLISLMAFITACEDDLYTSPIMQSKGTRSPSTEVSPLYNWEDTANIALFNIPGTVTLPWYSGAASNIPDFIIKDYKSADGWKMVYNTCSPSSIMQDDKYYLIFYNIFSGQFRGFIYNKNNVTSADHTFWQLGFNNSTTLLNDGEEYSLAADVVVENRNILLSPLTTTPIKALTRGWNVFDADLLMYDPNLSSKNIAMNISAYDIQTAQLILHGDIDLNSNGSMVTITKIPQSSGGGIFGGFISELGKLAEKKFVKIFDKKNFFHDKDLDTLASKGVGDIVKLGGNWLVNKFFGRKTVQTITSNSDIKISTEGTIETSGTFTSQQQSNVSPISHLMIPGSFPTDEDVFLPSYNEALGIWCLQETPQITYCTYDWFEDFLESIPGPRTHYVGVNCKKTRYTLNINLKDKVIINPAILPHIEKYEVEAKLMHTQKSVYGMSNGIMHYQIASHFSPTDFGTIHYSHISLQNYYYSQEDSIQIRILQDGQQIFEEENDISGEAAITRQEYDARRAYKRPTDYYKGWLDIPNNTVVKVSVTLYPKAPYNTTPVVTTRTFKPTFIYKKQSL